MRIIITGGHVTPALAIIDTLLAEGISPKNITFVGRKYAVEKEKNLSFEYKEVTRRGIKFIPLQAGRLTRIVSLQSLRNLLRVPLGSINAYHIINEVKPDKVMSFGGYIALPIAFWAYLKRIPVYTHEQTINPGIANRLIGRISKKIFVAFKETKKYFPKNKVIVCGNPIRDSVFKTESTPFELDNNKPTIYITGGSLGAHSINTKIKFILPELLKKYNVIHQVGNIKEYNDFKELNAFAKTLPPELKKRYFIREHIYDAEIGSVYALADLVIGRSGANTFFELMALQKPAILIPLPWSAREEQLKHAKLFKRMGLGEVVLQATDPSDLLTTIRTAMCNLDTYKKNFKKVTDYETHAARAIASHLN